MAEFRNEGCKRKFASDTTTKTMIQENVLANFLLVRTDNGWHRILIPSFRFFFFFDRFQLTLPFINHIFVQTDNEWHRILIPSFPFFLIVFR